MPTRRGDDTNYSLGTGLSASGSAVAVKGGEYMLFAEGTVGGSTVSLQMKAPSGTWMDVQAQGGLTVVKSTTLPFTATNIYLPAGDVRLALTGGTPSAVAGSLVGLG